MTRIRRPQRNTRPDAGVRPHERPTHSKKPTPAAASKSETLTNRLKPNQTPERAGAEMMVEGLAMNAATAVAYSRNMGELDLTECMAALVLETQKVESGSLGGPEATLAAQAITLNAMFTQLACQASKMTILDQIDRFTRLALKAQGQCRATFETLALMKNPPVFARQANIAHGPQQVNNGPVANGTPTRAVISENAPNRLLEAVEDGERLDGPAKGATGASDQTMEAVGAFDGATDHEREGARVAQCVPRRRTPGATRLR